MNIYRRDKSEDAISIFLDKASHALHKKGVILPHLFNHTYLSVGKKTINLVFLVIYTQNKSGNQMGSLERVEVYYKCITTLVKCDHYIT